MRENTIGALLNVRMPCLLALKDGPEVSKQIDFALNASAVCTERTPMPEPERPDIESIGTCVCGG